MLHDLFRVLMNRIIHNSLFQIIVIICDRFRTKAFDFFSITKYKKWTLLWIKAGFHVIVKKVSAAIRRKGQYLTLMLILGSWILKNTFSHLWKIFVSGNTFFFHRTKQVLYIPISLMMIYLQQLQGLQSGQGRPTLTPAV